MKNKSLTFDNLRKKSQIAWDQLNGLDFLTIIKPEEIGLDSSIHRSSPSGDKFLKKLLHDFNISSQDSIIDIGCGKGSAIRTMLKFPFKQVDGVELSEYIANIAIANFKKLKARSRIYITDAAEFKIYDEYNFIYFYNPFPGSIMLKVIEALVQSLEKKDRELVIIYNNATCHNEIVDSGIFAKIGAYPDKWGNAFSIYSNRSYSNSRLCLNKKMQRFV